MTANARHHAIDSTTTDPLEKRARRRVGLKVGFAIHLTVYLLVNTGLWLLGQASGRTAWVPYPLLGWGLGLAIHGLVTLFGLHGDGLRQRMLAAEMQHLRERG